MVNHSLHEMAKTQLFENRSQKFPYMDMNRAKA